MDNLLITPLIEYMQAMSAEGLAFLTFIFCIITVLYLLRVFGAAGLYLYNSIIVIAANIQVLKTAPFLFSPEPVALGTITFATTYLATDILTEHYGKTVARKGIWISFSSHILMTTLMIFTLGYTVVPEGDTAHQAMTTLFVPSPRILLAGLMAFALSQLLDIYLFDWVSRLTHRRWLWLRSNVATLLSGLVDNALFSIFAWVILSPTPIGAYKLIFTYILGTYLARALVSLLSTPVMYMSYWFLPDSKKHKSLKLPFHREKAA